MKKEIMLNQLKNFDLRSFQQHQNLQTFLIRRDINEIKELQDDRPTLNNPPNRMQTTLNEEINISAKILPSYSDTTREIYIPNQKLFLSRGFKEKDQKIKIPSIPNIKLKVLSRKDEYDNTYENMNKIEYIVKKNKENLDSLIENHANQNEFNIYKILFDNHETYTRSLKASHLQRSKYKNYRNSDPIYNQPNKKFKSLMERIKNNINQKNESEKYVEIGPFHSRRIISLKGEGFSFNKTNEGFRQFGRQKTEFTKSQMYFLSSKEGIDQTWN